MGNQTTEIKKKKIWILERNGSPLQRVDEGKADDPYTFVGPCATFEEVNDNERMYHKDDYIKHFEYLTPEIEANSLLGELDHNEDYMVSMKAISHMITRLWFDESSNQVMIQIKLLDTRDGKDAKAIVDGGAPLYISSRASGYIDDDGNVSLEKIYTYDIVYRPGFKNAKLERLNEKYGIKSKAVALYEWKDNGNNNGFVDKKSKKDMEKYATTDEINAIKESFDDYTTTLKNHFDSFKKDVLGAINDKKLHIKPGKQFADPIHENKQIKEDHLEGRDEKITFILKNQKGEVQYTKDDLDNMSDEDVYKAYQEVEGQTGEGEAINDIRKMMESVETDKEILMEYMDLVRKRVNEQGGYSNLTTKFVNKLADFCDLIVERVNSMEGTMTEISNVLADMTDHSELVTERVNNIVEYANEQTKRLNKLTEYSNRQTKRINQNTDYAEAIKERVNQNTDYSSLIAENQNKLRRTTHKAITEGKVGKSGKPKDILSERGVLSKKVDDILENVKKKGTNKTAIILEHKYPFINKLDNTTRELFESMSETKKKRVSSMIDENGSQVNEVISEVNKDDNVSRLLEAMPKKLIKVWEGLTPKEQQNIIVLSQTRDLRTNEEIELFWEGIDFGDHSPVNIGEHLKVDDELAPTIHENTSSLGYNDEDIDKDLGIE